MSIEKLMSNGNIILTSSECFLSLPWPFSTDARSAKDVDVGDYYIRDIGVNGICTRDTCTEGTCINGACIRST